MAADQQSKKEFLIEHMRLFFIATGKCCPAEGLDFDMVELAALNTDIINNIPQAAAAIQLRGQHSDKLSPAGGRPKLLRHVMRSGKDLKFMSRKNSYYLRKNSAKMVYDSETLVFNVFLAKLL